MGLFGDAFNISAGATLGNLAVKTGYQAAEEFFNATEKNAYNKMRSESFDPVVRQDLNDIIVRGMLQARDYPFLLDKVQRKENIFKRYKVFWIVTIIYLVIFFGYLYNLMNNAGYEDYARQIFDMTEWYFVFAILYASYRLGKKLNRGKKKLMQSGFRPKLIKDGQQYWHVREYIRQALASRQMSVQDAIIKISNTELGRQFPDTVDEIEANAFFYRQKLGL